jgi:transmembrane sensor
VAGADLAGEPMISKVTDQDGAMADASAWLARLQRDDVAERDGLEFEAWLAAAPENRSAYRRTLDIWHEFGTHAEDVLADLARSGPMRAAPTRRAPTRRWLIAGGGSALAAGLALAVLPSLLAPPEPATYATGKGQHRTVTLADGSVVDLNAETRLSVSFTRSDRRVVMAEGQAIFDVTHDERRPFTVEASGRVVRVLGTQFDVRNREGDLRVTVARGKVQVRPNAATTSGRAFLLTPGQRLEIGRTGVATMQIVNPQEALDWRTGRLVYRAEPLANVVADLNRQFVEQVEISDPALGEMPITGVIVLDDQAAVMTRLSLMLPIRSVPSQRGLLLLRK